MSSIGQIGEFLMQQRSWISTCSLTAMLLALATLTSLAAPESAPARVRAREAGVPFEGQPGPLDAITDVAGVEVGQVTLIEGDGALRVGKGPTRTGLTAIFPKG